MFMDNEGVLALRADGVDHSAGIAGNILEANPGLSRYTHMRGGNPLDSDCHTSDIYMRYRLSSWFLAEESSGASYQFLDNIDVRPFGNGYRLSRTRILECT